MSKAKEIMEKYRNFFYEADSEKDSDNIDDPKNVNSKAKKLLKNNGWKTKETSEDSESIDVVYINKKEDAWIWYDTNAKSWFYSDNPKKKTFEKLEYKDVIDKIDELS